MVNRLKSFWESVWAPVSETDPQGRFVTRLKFLIQLFYSATHRFQKDEDLVRAASISYAIIVSFIPTLLVGLILAANFINIRDYEELVKEYARKNGIPIDVSAYFKIVYDLLNNTAALTGIGFLFVLFSTTSVLRNLEEAMNKIWHIRTKRPFIQKVAEFIMIIVFGPILLTIGLSSGQKILNEFSAPSLVQVVEFQGKEMILGDKRMLLEREESGRFRFTKFLNKVDFEFQREPIVFDPETNTILNQRDVLPIQHRVKKATRSDTRESFLTDIATIDDKIYIVSENGSMFFSNDGGSYWQVRKFQRKQLNILVKSSFTKIHFFDKDNGIVLGKAGLILRTNDGGETWIPRFQNGLNVDLRDIAEIYPGTHMVIGENLTAFISRDQGYTWSPYKPIQSMDSIDRENLNSIQVIGNSIYICGDSGIILASNDSGKTWTRKNLAYKKIDFQDILFIDEMNGLLIGDGGNIRYTTDGGEVWKQSRVTSNVDLLKAHKSNITGNIYVVGRNHHILINKNPGSLDEFRILEKTPLWRLMVGALGSFFLPFIVLWLIFLFIYKIMPYTNVKFRAAAIGSFITSFALVCFLLGFQFYVSYFSAGKFAIYGTLAAIPLVLLIVYVSSIIVLYGCEVSFLIQHPVLIPLAYHRRNTHEMEKSQIWKGIQVLYKVHSNYLHGRGESQDSRLMKSCSLDPSELDRILDVYLKNEIISRTESGGILPVVSAEHINLEHLTDILSPSGYDITDYNSKDIFIKEVKSIFEEYSKARKSIFGKRTLADLLVGTEQGDNKKKHSHKSTTG